MGVSAVAVALLTGATLVVLPGDASACGGLFCDRPPPDPFAPLPVAQNGENIVFSITPDPAGGAPTLVAHIQILYTGDAAKFSWVVPVDAAPVLTVGTDRLFSALSGLTQPRFQTTSLTEGTCRSSPAGSGGATASGGTSGGAGGSTGAGGAPGGVTVAFQGAVGPFDAAVIKSDDPTALKVWLTDNGYTVSDGAAALIDSYVAEGKYFVALKLLNGVGVQSIQPIVLTFRGTEPCVPLRLTAIAANPDMPVLLWVLADRRVVPKGYYELEIDEAAINWLSGGANYFGPKGLVSTAANQAGGKAFVAEYAGTSAIARAAVYANGQIDPAALRKAMTPPAYVQQLVSMGLASDPQTLPLLSQYIPMPQAVVDMGVTPSQFYGNLSLYWSQYAFPTFDLSGLTDAVTAKIIQPRIDAQMMIDAHPYLTRLNTFISPDEMDRDPLFLVNPDLGDVSNVHQAVLRTMCGNSEFLACNAPVRLELSDGRKTWVRAGSPAATCQGQPYDMSRLMALPALSRAWERSETGAGTSIMDESAAIAAGLAANDAAFPAEQQRFGAAGGGGAGGGTGSGGGLPSAVGAGGVMGDTGGRGGSVTSPPVGTDGGVDRTRPASTGGGDGCACGVGPSVGQGSAAGGSLALAVALGVARARRRRAGRHEKQR
jgi:uncharacterized membrane protein YgcG